MNMSYKPAKRNYDGIRHQKIREEIDEYFGRLHDEISRCFYDREEFVWENYNFGIPSKEFFDKVHKLSNDARFIAFHWVNKQLEQDSTETKISEDDYRYERDSEGTIIKDKLEDAKETIRWIIDNYPSFKLKVSHSKYGNVDVTKAIKQV